MTEYYLVTSSFNWADEIDFNGFDIISGTERERLLEKLGNMEDESTTFYCGTNEEVEIEWSEFKSELEKAEKLTEEEYEIITNKVGFSCGDTLYHHLSDSNELNAETIDDINFDVVRIFGQDCLINYYSHCVYGFENEDMEEQCNKNMYLYYVAREKIWSVFDFEDINAICKTSLSNLDAMENSAWVLTHKKFKGKWHKDDDNFIFPYILVNPKDKEKTDKKMTIKEFLQYTKRRKINEKK